MQKKLTDVSHDDPGKITGVLERVVFRNDDNGYTVFRIKPDGSDDLLTAVGTLPSARVGSRVELNGQWTEHPRFGKQFKAERVQEIMPSSEEGMRLFLASGCIEGIGPRWADKIVTAFGAETFHVLDEEPERLLEIPRFGQRRLDAVLASWGKQQGIRDLMTFLQGHGVSGSLAMRVYNTYREKSLDVVRENPYRLALDVRGIGFVTADSLAQKLGFSTDDPLRAEAGLMYSLSCISNDGHMYFPREILLQEASQKLKIGLELLEQALDNLEYDGRVITEDMDGERGVYLERSYQYETKIAYYLSRLMTSPRAVRFSDIEKSVGEVLAALPLKLAQEQKEAVMMAAGAKAMVLTGGPGTGKTTILNAIINVYKRAGAKVLMAAPTGRAAKRMSETCGTEAKTIHRLLEYSPMEDGFGRNEDNPLSCSLLVVDEASMMDTMLMYHLVKAIPSGSAFILIGDVNQLPSVGPGNVLRDIIASGIMPVAELTKVFRQGNGEIISNAHRINNGEMPVIRHGQTDFYFFRQDDPQAAAELIVDIVKNRIPGKFAIPSSEIQVLAPMLRGAAGVNHLNERLQSELNPTRPVLKRGERIFKCGDKVMQLRNNYDHDVYNGDIGIVEGASEEERTLSVNFDGRTVCYSWEETDELVPAYAISIHKSQGGEYPAVVIPLMMQHYVMLQRNLVYTAVTRGKKLVVIVGEYKAVAMAVKNNHIRPRYTRLAYRLAPGRRPLRPEMLPGGEMQVHLSTDSGEDL